MRCVVAEWTTMATAANHCRHHCRQCQTNTWSTTMKWTAAAAAAEKKLRKKKWKRKNKQQKQLCVVCHFLYFLSLTHSSSLTLSRSHRINCLRTFDHLSSSILALAIPVSCNFPRISLSRALSQMMKRWLKSRSLVFYCGDSWYVFVFVGNVWIWNNVTPRATFKFSQSLNCIRWQHMNIYIRILCASRAGKSNFLCVCVSTRHELK